MIKNISFYEDIKSSARKYLFASTSLGLSLFMLGGCASDKAEIALQQDREARQLQLEELGKNRAEQFQALNEQLTELRTDIASREANQKARIKQIETRLIRLDKKLKKMTAPTVHKIRKAATQKSKPRHKIKKIKKPATHKIIVDPRPVKQAPVISDEVIRRRYIKAYLTLKSGHYDQASTDFKNFLMEFPVSKYTYLASYWLGETLHAQGKTALAIEAFRKIASAPNKTPKRKAALLRLGQLYHELGKTDKAKTTLSRLISDHPQSPEAETARKILAESRL